LNVKPVGASPVGFKRLISCISSNDVIQTLKSSPWNRIAAFGELSLFYTGTLVSPNYFVYCTCASAAAAPCAYLPVKSHMSVILSQLY
jgi:hypothetical protein